MAALRVLRLPLYPLIVAREKLARGERPREVGGEPAIMDEPQGVAEYDALGAEVEVGIHQFNALGLSRLLPDGGTLLDLGCGTGRLLARLARGRPDASVIGLDLSAPMLQTGRELMRREGLDARVDLRRGDITAFDADLPDRVDVVSCSFALHHLPDDATALRCLEAIARVQERTGCAVWIFDFARLHHAHTFRDLTSLAQFPGPVVLNDAIASEQAAFTFAELTALLDRAGVRELQHLRSRPLGEHQLHVARGREGAPAGRWHGPTVDPAERLMTMQMLLAFPRSLTR